LPAIYTEIRARQALATLKPIKNYFLTLESL